MYPMQWTEHCPEEWKCDFMAQKRKNIKGKGMWKVAVSAGHISMTTVIVPEWLRVSSLQWINLKSSSETTCGAVHYADNIIQHPTQNNTWLSHGHECTEMPAVVQNIPYMCAQKGNWIIEMRIRDTKAVKKRRMLV